MRRRLESHLTEVWYGSKPPGLTLRALSHLFSALRTMRLGAYERGFLATETLPVPVIVVGNITVGGTGKTPLVIALANALSILGWRPGIVSRGSGRRSSSGPQVVQDDSDPAIVGDEPLLIRRKTHCPTAVHKKRSVAANHLLTQTDVNLIICDDGLQHLALGRDIELVLHTPHHSAENKHLLPAGPYREPEAVLARADIVLATGTEADDKTVGITPGEWAALGEETGAPTPGDTVNAVAGIGNPSRYFDLLRRLGYEVIEHPFPDHHEFQSQDLVFSNPAPIVMTEKDAVKCESMNLANAFVLPLVTTLPPHLASDIDDLLHQLGEAT